MYVPVSEIGDGVIECTETAMSPEWDEPLSERAAMRFLDVDALTRLLVEAGFTIEHQYSDWDGSPLADDSAEIITVARR